MRASPSRGMRVYMRYAQRGHASGMINTSHWGCSRGWACLGEMEWIDGRGGV